MRIRIAAVGLAMAVMAAQPAAPPARGQAALSDLRLAQAAPLSENGFADPPTAARGCESIARTSAGFIPSYNPGPDAVRECTAHYVEEYRPSGTVIVPRMNCFLAARLGNIVAVAPTEWPLTFRSKPTGGASSCASARPNAPDYSQLNDD